MNQTSQKISASALRSLDHLISMHDLHTDTVRGILDRAEEIDRGELSPNLRGTVAALLFFEPSTRTHFSFETAMKRMGGETISMSGTGTSSVTKGESFADTIRTFGLYSDIIVIRSPVEGAARFASEIARVPVVNAGDGANQHPTQALLDLYSIRACQGRLDELSVAVVGDLKFGRTVHSLVQALSPFNPKLHLVSPPHLRLPDYLLDRLRGRAGVTEHTDLAEVIDEVDVLYVTRIQRERFADPEEYEQVKNCYIVDCEMLRGAKPTMRVLHPMPRVNEIAPEVDGSQHAYYFEQAKHGIAIRQAILSELIRGNANGIENETNREGAI